MNLIRCEYCGAPGYRLAVAPDLMVDPGNLDQPFDQPFHVIDTCDRHRRIVMLRAERAHAPRRAAYREGRAV